MNNPVITWFVKEDDGVYTAHTNYYAGSCNPNEDFYIELEVWNNRWNNTEDVKNAENAEFILTFENAEDSSLLLLCEAKVGEGDFNKINLTDFNKGSISLGTLSGGRNTGVLSHTDNYRRITLKFSNVPGNFKEGLKSMIAYIDYDIRGSK